MSVVDLNDPIIRELVGARVRLLLEKPWFGTMACRLILVDATGWCDTAATDGRHFFYNREFIKNLTPDELLFLFGHEVLHVVFDHIGRRGHRDPKLHNMAADYIVNWTLRKEGVGTMPKHGLYDEKYTDEMSSEEVYELLLKNSVEIKMPLDMHLEASGNSKDGDDDGDQDGQSGAGGDKEAKVRVMGKDGPPKLTEADLQKIRNEVRAALIQSAQQFGAGKVPLGVRRLLDSLTQPKMDWRALLDAHIRSMVRDDYTFQRLNRRVFHTGWLMPSQDYQTTVDLFISIDASGSITNEQVRDFLSEVKGIMDTFRDYRIGVVTFDHDVYNWQKFTPENGEDILNYNIKGGGGTSFEAVYEFMKKNNIEPERHVMFTDGYPNGTWGDPDYCDTLHVIHGTESIVAPFGMTAYYDNPNKQAVRKRAA